MDSHPPTPSPGPLWPWALTLLAGVLALQLVHGRLPRTSLHGVAPVWSAFQGR